MADGKFVTEALIESNEFLQEENSRLRNSNRMLRAVVSALRGVNTKLRASVEIAQQNDQIFKSFCQGDFDAPVLIPADAGLADAVNTVEPTV